MKLYRLLLVVALLTLIIIVSACTINTVATKEEKLNKKSCSELLVNGDPQNKINFFFVAENFDSKEEFINHIKYFIGLNTSDSLTLLNYIPFSEFKNDYNIYYQFIPMKDYGCADSTTVDPNDKRFCFNSNTALEFISSICGDYALETDFIVVLSKKSFIPSADHLTPEEIDPRTKIVRLSLNLLDVPPEKRENFIKEYKRVVLHEFAHSLGFLSDEYINFDKQQYKPVSGIGAANIDTESCPKWCSGILNVAAPHYLDYASYKSCIQNLDVNNPEDNDMFRSCYSSVPSEAFQQDFGVECEVGSGCFWGAGGMNGFRSVANSLMWSGLQLGPVNERIARKSLESLVISRELKIKKINIEPLNIKLVRNVTDKDRIRRTFTFRIEFNLTNQDEKPILIQVNGHNYDLYSEVYGQRNNIVRNIRGNDYYVFYDYSVSIKDYPDLNIKPGEQVIMNLGALYNKVNAKKTLAIYLYNVTFNTISTKN